MVWMKLVELFALKMVDTIIGSGKTIFMIKNMKFMSALSQAVSNVFYIILMSRLMKSTDPLSILVTSLAMFIGQYLSQWIAEKLDKAKVWKIQITATSREQGLQIVKELVENNCAVQSYNCYRNGEKVIGINVFAESKAQSAIVHDILSNKKGAKFNITAIKNRF